MEPLDVFFAAYVNQDFDIITGSPLEVVVHFGRTELEIVDKTRESLSLMLARHDDDQGLLDEATARGCEYLPSDPADFRALMEFAVTTWGSAAPAVADSA
jgi:CdiI immunity protein